ncbi:MAG: OmpA family protein [Saprospiraceae bacterium]
MIDSINFAGMFGQINTRRCILVLGLCLGWSLLPAQYLLERLDDQINTAYDEIAPVVTPDGGTLFFTRVGDPTFKRTLYQFNHDLSAELNSDEYFELLSSIYSQLANKSVSSPVSSGFNQDVWMATSAHGVFDKIYHPGFPLNNALPNSICAYSEADQSLLIINQFGKDGSLYHGFSKIRQTEHAEFDFPEPIYIYDFYSQSDDVSAALSYDNDVIVLALDRKDSRGDQDLYISFKVKENLWSSPINLGPDINTSFRESTPYLSRDKKRLFFASNRPGSEGMDIYVSRRIDVHWSKWTKPRKVVGPINGPYDDTQPYYSEIDDYFYFTSNRDGSYDIFRVNFSPNRTPPRLITIQGRIIDEQTQQPIRAELTYSSLGPIRQNYFFRSSNGQYSIQLQAAHTIQIQANQPGYLSNVVEIEPDVWQQSSDSVLIVDIPLEPIKEDRKIEVSNIFFEQSKPKILPESYPELNRLVQLLKQNPNIHILIEGHTDNVGDLKANIELSQKRAMGIKEYLVYNGIAKERIDTKGFGPTKPLNDNSTEEKRRENRRVEIKITKSSP